MRIVELVLWHVRIPLKRTIRHALHTRNDTDSLIVRCTLDDGTIGWGEGLPRSYVTGETIDSGWEQLRLADWNRELGGSLSFPDEVLHRAAEFQLPANGDDPRQCVGNAARCAVELSVLDATTRSAGIPLSAVTALLPETLSIRESRSRVQYSAAVTAMGPLRLRLHAWFVRLYGFRHCKVKVGVDGVDDVALLKRVRGIMGGEIDIRVDANESWTCDALERRLDALKPFQVSAVEQPVPHAAVGGLARLRGKLGIPIMLDESVCSREDARRAVEHGTCDLFNIRLSKCGGFVRSLQIAALAHGAGLGYQLGCQVGETGILSAAGRHFACSVAGIRYLEGSNDRYLVRERLTHENLTFRYGGYAPALAGPGLGITIDETALNRVAVREQRLRLM